MKMKIKGIKDVPKFKKIIMSKFKYKILKD